MLFMLAMERGAGQERALEVSSGNGFLGGWGLHMFPGGLSALARACSGQPGARDNCISAGT